MKYLIFLFFIFSFSDAQPKGKCFSLEKKTLGCVPSTDHPCPGKIEAIENGVIECEYVKDTDWHYKQKQQGPIALQCGTATEKRLRPGCSPEQAGEDPSCFVDYCPYYFPPVCEEECETCFPIIEKTQVPNKGCYIQCKRERCSDEPWAGGDEFRGCIFGTENYPACKRASCPALHPTIAGYEKREDPWPACGTKAPKCPTTVVTPEGDTLDVKIIKPPCTVQQRKPPKPGAGGPLDCPWTTNPPNRVTVSDPYNCPPIPDEFKRK